MFFMTKFKPFCYNLNLLFHAFCNLVVHIVMNYLLQLDFSNKSVLICIVLSISITSTNLQSQSSETRTGSGKVSIPEIMSILDQIF